MGVSDATTMLCVLEIGFVFFLTKKEWMVLMLEAGGDV